MEHGLTCQLYCWTPASSNWFNTDRLTKLVRLFTDIDGGGDRLNLAGYLTTHMEKEVEALIAKSINVNLADAVEYPSCVTMNDRQAS